MMGFDIYGAPNYGFMQDTVYSSAQQWRPNQLFAVKDPEMPESRIDRLLFEALGKNSDPVAAAESAVAADRIIEEYRSQQHALDRVEQERTRETRARENAENVLIARLDRLEQTVQDLLRRKRGWFS